MSVSEKNLPDYTLGEELCNSISHGIGALLSVAALVLCVVRGAFTGSAYAVVSGAIYGASLIILYCNSTIYHALKRNKAKRVMRVIDHCSIFFLIAGTYTPYTLIVLRKASVGWAWSIFGVVWGAAVLGVVLNSISLERFKKLSMICYIAMGWSIVIAFKPLMSVFTGAGLQLLIWGGVAYTVGAVLYGVGKKVKYIHSLFHIFVVAGSLLHFFSIYLYAIPMA